MKIPTQKYMQDTSIAFLMNKLLKLGIVMRITMLKIPLSNCLKIIQCVVTVYFPL